MFRGLPMVVAARVLGRGRAIVLLSVLFAMAHVTNPDVTAAAICNIALAGIFLSLGFFSPGRHLDRVRRPSRLERDPGHARGAGERTAFDIPYIDYRWAARPGSREARSGPKAASSATGVLAAAAVLVARWIRKEPT